jgi:hypothetical protein
MSSTSFAAAVARLKGMLGAPRDVDALAAAERGSTIVTLREMS